MFNWFFRWPKRLASRRNHTVLGQQTWELPPSPAPRWTTAESKALLQSEQKKTICCVTGSFREQPMQTVLLGCDLPANQLLLDDFFPRPKTPLIGGRFQISVPMDTGLLVLQVVIREEIGVAPTPAFIAEVMEKATVKDRRLTPRLHFTSAVAPGVDLIVPMSPRMRGHLLDLSEHGFSMVFYGAAKPQLFTRNGECRIDFDESFSLSASVLIQQVRTRRKPFHHTVIRTHFGDLSATEKDRIAAFVRSCTTRSEHLDAA